MNTLQIPRPGTDDAATDAVRFENLVHGRPAFNVLEGVFLRVEAAIERAIPPALNPFAQLGAIANTLLVIAVVSGVAMLLWYVPSVTEAYQSLEALRQSSFLGQLVRSVHRYSSDACVLFVLLHALRVLAQRRFTGPRWLPWCTGILILSTLWTIGWTGYWLVWDVRAQHAALGSAAFIDPIPIFSEPFSKSFLTDSSVHSLIFFVIFFLHMLLPLAIGIGLWIHLARVNRARLLTAKPMTLWLLGSLVAASLVLPAESAAAAQMTVKAQRFTMDAWYLWPIYLTDRLGGGVLWAVFLGAGLAAGTLPWTLGRRSTPSVKADVETARCIGCSLCSQDCPFNAITMIPREDGRKFEVQAQVDPDLCVSCGICTGACDSQAINLPLFNSRDVERRVATWVERCTAEDQRPFVAFHCGASAGRALQRRGWPNVLPVEVPCAGWVSSWMLERALQKGAAGVIVIACAESDPACREGATWFKQRIADKREPALSKRTDRSRIFFTHSSEHRSNEMLRAVEQFVQGGAQPSAKTYSKGRILTGSIALTLLLMGIVLGGSVMPYRTQHTAQPELVVSINHRGRIAEPRKLTEEELAKRLPHMRAQVNTSRERLPVRLRVEVDGRVVANETYAAKGLSKDGSSVGTRRFEIPEGRHEVRVLLGDGADPNAWTQEWSGTMEFEESRRKVILFDTRGGFSVH